MYTPRPGGTAHSVGRCLTVACRPVAFSCPRLVQERPSQNYIRTLADTASRAIWRITRQCISPALRLSTLHTHPAPTCRSSFRDAAVEGTGAQAWKRMHRPIAHCCRAASVGTLTARHKTRRRSRPEIARARSSFSPRAVAFAMASCTATHATILRCVMHARAMWEGREHARKEP